MRFLLTTTAVAALAFNTAQAADDDAYLASAREAFAAVSATGDPYLAQSVLEAFLQVRPDLSEPLTALFFDVAEMPKAEAPADVPVVAETAPEPSTTEAEKPEAPSGLLGFAQGWDGNANFGFEVQTGNTEEVELDLGVDVTRAFGKWEVDALATAGLAEANATGGDRVRIQEEYRIRLDARRSYGERWTFENFLDAQRDLFSGFDYRVSVGIGPGYKILMQDRLKWRIAAGPGVRFDKLQGQDDWETNPVATFSSAFRWQPTDSLTFGNDFDSSWGEGQVISINTFAETQLINRLSARLSHDIGINSDAPATAETTDTTTLLSLVYKIGKGK